MNTLRTGFFMLCATALSACVSTPAEDSYPLILEGHDLAGKIWDVRAQQFIEQEKLFEKIGQSEYILLGETHDNMLHHHYQSSLIRGLHESGASALVAFEMITEEQGKIIQNRNYASSSELIDDLNQVKTTWRYERRYKPVFDSILAAGYPIAAANLDRNTIMGMARKGKDSVPDYLKPYLEKNVLTGEQEQALKHEIKMSHCGMENPHMTSAMMLTQRVKDAAMADSLVRDIKVDKRVLVAGSGHVRNDRGVPMYIRRDQENVNMLALAWLEVVGDFREIKQYARQWGGETMPFDYVWFTPRVDRPDPCKSFRQHMKKKATA